MKHVNIKFIQSVILSLFLVSFSFSDVDLKPTHAGLALEYGQMADLQKYEKNPAFGKINDGTFTQWLYSKHKLNKIKF